MNREAADCDYDWDDDEEERVRWLSGIDYFAVSLCRFVALITTNYRQHSLTFHSDYALIITMAIDAHWLSCKVARTSPSGPFQFTANYLDVSLFSQSIYPCSDCNSVLYKPNDQIYSLFCRLYILLFCSLPFTLKHTHTFTFAPIHTSSRSISSLS